MYKALSVLTNMEFFWQINIFYSSNVLNFSEICILVLDLGGKVDVIYTYF